VLYNNPITVRWSTPLKIIDTLSKHPNIVGFKDSENSVDRINESTAFWVNRTDFSYLMGCAAHSSYALIKGCDGIVPSAGNLVPELYKKLFEAVINGKPEEANKYQLQTNRVSDIYQSKRNISRAIPALKVIMSEYGLCKPFVMPPMYDLDPEEQMNLKLQIREVMNTLTNVTV
jgi:4-hydroxy-tetrahydrodipicolinate synthase